MLYPSSKTTTNPRRNTSKYNASQPALLLPTEAEAEILGAPEKHVKLGSILRLVCIMHHTTEALSYVFWYRGNEMINYESEEGTGVSIREAGEQGATGRSGHRA